MPSPLLSIIIPVCNAEPHLPELLEAVRNQTLDEFEVLAINDGSQDRSLEILQAAAATFPKLKVLTQSNLGVSAARNQGLREATGTWIGFLDSDDWVDPSAWRSWTELAKCRDLDLLLGNGFSFSGKVQATSPRKPLLTKQPWEEILVGKQWITSSIQKREWPHYVWLQLVHRDLLLRHGITFREGMVHEDILWTLDVSLVAERMGFCSTPMIGYRRNPESIMGNHSPEAIQTRAFGYLPVLEGLSEAADQNAADPELRRALNLEANRQGGHLLGLLRKRKLSSKQSREIARAFFKRKLAAKLLRGAQSFNDYWRALRCLVALLRSRILPD